METELQQAERFARNVMTNQLAFVADVVAVCRVFLAQQARLAEVERERDEWRTAWDGVNTHRNQLREALAAAERKATDAVEARRVGLFTDGATWLAGRMGHNASAIVMTQYEAAEEARRRYPAPTEREAEQPSVFRTPAAFSSSIFVTEACADCEALNGNEWSVAGRVYCPKHSITLRPTPPQAAPEPGVIVPSRIWLPVKDGKVCINPRDAANFALMADAHAEASHDASGRGE